MLTKELWGKSPCGKDIHLYTLKNSSGAYVQVSSIGAGIVSVVVPDRDGNLADVVLGYPDPISYFNDGPCAGKTPGRFAGRIANGRFTIDGIEYSLPVNNGPNHLHGGPDGFHNKVWESGECDEEVIFTYCSQDGEMGYPGTLNASIRYKWLEDNTLQITLEATSDAATIVNLTNHAYFNLNGEGNGDIRNHLLKLHASEYIPTDPDFIPTGEIAPVDGTPMDFREAKSIGEGMAAEFPDIIYGRGYNTCWILESQANERKTASDSCRSEQQNSHNSGTLESLQNGRNSETPESLQNGQIRTAAILSSPSSGRSLTVRTSQPGLVIYTGGWLSDSPVGKCGRTYNDHEGVALECQNIPDAPNHPCFPSAVLRPGEQYLHRIHFSFGVEECDFTDLAFVTVNRCRKPTVEQ